MTVELPNLQIVFWLPHRWTHVMSCLRALYLALLGFGFFLFGEAIIGVTYGLPTGLMMDQALTWTAISWAGAAGIVLGLSDVAVQLLTPAVVRRFVVRQIFVETLRPSTLWLRQSQRDNRSNPAPEPRMKIAATTPVARERGLASSNEIDDALSDA